MLGSIRDDNTWNWAASGKHSTIKDFFMAGPHTPMIKAFAEWVGRGYERLKKNQEPASKFHSWRFWTKGSQKEKLVCGILRDSGDSIGRLYPLMIMGTGMMVDWEKHWESLPFCFEKTWAQMERISIKRFRRVSEFEEEIKGIPSPSSDWSSFSSQAEQYGNLNSFGNVNPMNPDRINTDNEFILPLQAAQYEETIVHTFHALSVLKKHSGTIPNAVFLGGVPEATYLAIYMRPLMPEDFVRLWRIGVEET